MDFPHYFEIGMKYFAYIFVGLFCFMFIKEMIVEGIIGLAKMFSGQKKTKRPNNKSSSKPWPKDFLSAKNLRKNGISL